MLLTRNQKLIKLCRRITLILAPSKFSLSTAVKFGGTIISEEFQKVKLIFTDEIRLYCVRY